tara:strand:- start:596 stop:703 length:108 start_codon:yes stop_codon:yes gene_type:complete
MTLAAGVGVWLGAGAGDEVDISARGDSWWDFGLDV